ncbi:MAG: actin-binding WH2 domain-containing protein, partial [Chloroflexi bacterium]|nr:actin-binding WH2 domain-containing protein [Chloroflexota bacterium]
MNETLRARNLGGALDAFRVIDRILRNRNAFFSEIREGQEVNAKIRDMLISSAVFLALYGAVMGSTSPHWQQALASAIKLPVLFLITLIICLPSLYFFNLFFGSRLTFFQTLALVLTAITVTSVLLVSFLPITLFFWWTAPSYQFFKLLNVGIFALTGVFGVVFL